MTFRKAQRWCFCGEVCNIYISTYIYIYTYIYTDFYIYIYTYICTYKLYLHIIYIFTVYTYLHIHIFVLFPSCFPGQLEVGGPAGVLIQHRVDGPTGAVSQILHEKWGSDVMFLENHRKTIGKP